MRQCIHAGFGIERYGEELTGPEYMARDIETMEAEGVEAMLGTMVLDLSPDRVLTVSSAGGVSRLRAGAVVLAMGCRERTRENVMIPGTRPAGVYTAGAAQNLMNLRNIMVGRRVVVLGSGDVGLIMARRMALEGAEVACVAEVMPVPGGLARNVRQCLDDLGIPLLLGHTAVEVRGEGRVSSVVLARVGEDLLPVPGTEMEVECDTLLLSVGLIPENELSSRAGIELDPATGGPVVDGSFMTNVPGVFACGNALHVHDVADWVSEEGAEAGRSAARWLSGDAPDWPFEVAAGRGLRYALPHRSGPGGVVKLRVSEPARDADIVGVVGSTEVFRKRFARAVPSEMLRVELPEWLDNVERLILEVERG